jgi:hypothetical protein
VKKILEAFPDLTENDVRSTSSGTKGRDIQLSQRALGHFNYAVECKNKARIAIYNDYEQATTHVKDDEIPLLVIKQNRSEPLVVMSLDHFFELIKNKCI